jgi:hypothetical protein
MAITALSLGHGSIRPTREGAYPTPYTTKGMLHGTSQSYRLGDVLLNNSGQLDEAAEDPVSADVFGFVAAALGPRRQDQAPLTSGTAPAAALAGQRTTPGSGAPDWGNIDDDNWSVQYFPAAPGIYLEAHLTGTNSNGTDAILVAATHVNVNCGLSITVASGGSNAEVDYATAAGLWIIALNGDTAITQSDDTVKTVAIVNPQSSSYPSATFVDGRARPLSDASNGTLNPRMVFAVVGGAFF